MYSITLLKPILLALSAGTLAMAQDATNATNMNITVFAQPNCYVNSTNGSQYGIAPLTYGHNMVSSVAGWQMQSYKLSRNTTLQEQLDFSGSTKGMGSVDGIPWQCTLYHETTSPDSNGNTLVADTCYGLLLGPAQVSALPTQEFAMRQLLIRIQIVHETLCTKLNAQGAGESVAPMCRVFVLSIILYLFLYRFQVLCAEIQGNSGEINSMACFSYRVNLALLIRLNAKQTSIHTSQPATLIISFRFPFKRRKNTPNQHPKENSSDQSST